MKKLLLLIFLIPNLSYSACNVVNGKKYGDCNNVTINKSNPESLTISSYETISGITKYIKILNGGNLNLSGISNGNIIIEKGGSLTISGMANSISNNGGKLILSGTANRIYAKDGVTRISGIVNSLYGDGEIQLESGAVVNGKVNE